MRGGINWPEPRWTSAWAAVSPAITYLATLTRSRSGPILSGKGTASTLDRGIAGVLGSVHGLRRHLRDLRIRRGLVQILSHRWDGKYLQRAPASPRLEVAIIG